MDKVIPKSYWEFDRISWSSFKKTADLKLDKKDINAISGLTDPIDMNEVDLIYRPLCALLQIRYELYLDLINKQNIFFSGNNEENLKEKVPFIIAIAGSVAVGKSSVARLLQRMLSELPSKPNVDLVTTDGFLYPNSFLKANDIMDRKGFPISYNSKLLSDFLFDVKSGKKDISIPKYSHIEYDILKDEYQLISNPDILIIEGLNVLQPVISGVKQSLNDFFNFSIYIDADPVNIEDWYIERFLRLRETAFVLENSYFKNYATLNDEEAIAKAKYIWKTINLKNLQENIYHTRTKATAIIYKGKKHRVENILLRKP